MDTNTPCNVPLSRTDLASPIESVGEFRRRYDAIRSRIDDACIAAGRHRDDVRILPVSKTVDERRIRMAYAAGCREFGENKVQEARQKQQAMAELNIRWSVVGHLQSNKVKHVARFAAEFQALDSLALAELLDRRLQEEGRAIDVFVQVNSSGEASKYGLPPEEIRQFLSQLRPYSSLRIRGLMTLAIFTSDRERVRHCFSLMRGLRERLRDETALCESLDDLSMGMSSDFDLAVKEGATVVRVGQALFGPRALPDSHYWPIDAS